MTFTLSIDRLASPSELEPLPVLSLRYLPASDPTRPPAAAELVTISPKRATLHDTAGLGPDLWAGRVSVTMDSPSAVDPWHLCAPTGRILGGFTQTSDFSLPLGTVVKDYVADGMAVSDDVASARERSRLSRGSRMLRPRPPVICTSPVPEQDHRRP